MDFADKLFSDKSGQFEKTVALLTLVAVPAMLVITYADFWDIVALRHDALTYRASYMYELKTEGRWVNYLLFEYLKTFDFRCIVLANMLCFAGFSHICFRKFLEFKYAALCALTATLIPPVFLLNEWPFTLQPSFLLLFCAALLHDRLETRLFFLLFGILFNGEVSHFYFLLVFLFADQTKTAFLKILAYWVAGFIIGYLCANLVTYLISGQYIHIDWWRYPHYIASLSDLADNLASSQGFLLSHMKAFGYPVFLLALVGAMIVAFSGNVSVDRKIVVLLAACLAAEAPYMQSVPVGIVVSERTALSFLFASLFITAFAFARHKTTLPFVLIFLCVHFHAHNHQNLEYISKINTVWYKGLEDIGPNPATLKGIVLLSDDREAEKHTDFIARNLSAHPASTETLGASGRWHPVAHEYGFAKVFHGKAADRILEECRFDRAGIGFQENDIYRYAYLNGYLFIALRIYE